MNQNVKYGLRYGTAALLACVGAFCGLYALSYLYAESEYKKEMQEIDKEITKYEQAQNRAQQAKTCSYIMQR